MRHTTKLLLLLIIFSASFYHSSAQEKLQKTFPLRFLIRGSLEFGGDRVAEVYFTNGEKQSVRAGQGGTIAIGAEFQVPGVERLLFDATVGYKYVTTQADNVHIRMTRVPVQLMANWMATKKLRLGAGVVTHQAIRFKADGIGENMKFEAATGPTFEVAYAGVGLSYTPMTYKDQNHYSYSANAIGVTFRFAIPKR
jgi:hypothetical protein